MPGISCPLSIFHRRIGTCAKVSLRWVEEGMGLSLSVQNEGAKNVWGGIAVVFRKVALMFVCSGFLFANCAQNKVFASSAGATLSASRVFYTSVAQAENATHTLTVNLVALDYKFAPETLTVTHGTRVTVHLFNRGKSMHNWTLTSGGYTVSTPNVKPGHAETVTFMAGKKGEFPFYCSVRNHKEMGMVGKLIIR